MRTSPKLKQSGKRSFQDFQPAINPPRRLRARRTRALSQPTPSSAGCQSAVIQGQVAAVGELQAGIADLVIKNQSEELRVKMPAVNEANRRAVLGMEVDAHHEQDLQDDIVNRGEQCNLDDWLDPVVPGPGQHPPVPDIDGWSSIDSIGAWDCGLCQFRTLEDVPPPYRVKWTRALSTILGRILAAQTEDEQNRGLKWFLISAQVLFREPKRGGTRGQSNGHLTARFDCLINGDWGSLLSLWKADKRASDLRQGRGRGRQRAEDPALSAAKLRKTVLAMLARGQVGRAVRRICSNGVPSMDDPEVRAVLQTKYKPREKDLPATVTKGECLQALGGLRESLLELATGVFLDLGA